MSDSSFESRLIGLSERARWVVGPSKIDGQGVIAKKTMAKDEVVGVAMYQISQGSDELELTALARYCNHSPDPNLRVESRDNGIFGVIVYFRATKKILPAEEMLVDYGASTAALQGRNYTWKGFLVPSVSECKLKSGFSSP